MRDPTTNCARSSNMRKPPQAVLRIADGFDIGGGGTFDLETHGFQALWVGMRPGRIGRGHGNLFVVEQGGDGLVVSQIGQFLDLIRCAAKSGPVKQMGWVRFL